MLLGERFGVAIFGAFCAVIAREQQELKAHTWIKVGERTIVGGESEARFTILAIFP